MNLLKYPCIYYVLLCVFRVSHAADIAQIHFWR